MAEEMKRWTVGRLGWAALARLGRGVSASVLYAQAGREL